MERLDRDKHSSLLRTVVTYGRKKFCNTATWLADFDNLGGGELLRDNGAVVVQGLLLANGNDLDSLGNLGSFIVDFRLLSLDDFRF